MECFVLMQPVVTAVLVSLEKCCKSTKTYFKKSSTGDSGGPVLTNNNVQQGVVSFGMHFNHDKYNTKYTH